MNRLVMAREQRILDLKKEANDLALGLQADPCQVVGFLFQVKDPLLAVAGH